MRNRYKLVTVCAIVLLLGVALAVVVLARMHQTNPFPETVTDSVGFDLAYPTKDALDPGSIQTVGGVVSYSVAYRDSLLHVSMQSLPKNLDFSDFEKQIAQPKYIRTPSGKAVLGTLSNHQIGSLRTDDCWILITATRDTPQSDIEAILLQLKKADS